LARGEWLIMSNILKHISTSVGSTVASQVVLALSVPAVTRLYDPQAFGHWAIAFATAGILSTFGGGCYERAIPLCSSDRSATVLTILSFGICAIVSMIALFGLWLAGTFRLLGDLLTGSPPLAFAALVAFLLFGMLGIQVWRYWCVRAGRFAAFGAIQLVQASTTVGAQLALALPTHGSVQALFAASVGAQVVTNAFALAWLRPPILRELASPRLWTRAVALLKRYRNFPAFSAPYSLVVAAGKQGILLLVGAFTTAGFAGQVAMASRMTTLPVTMIVPGLNATFYHHAARASAEGVRSVIDAFQRYQVPASAVLAAPAILLAEPIAGFVLGDRWSEAGRLASPLIVYSYVIFNTAWLDRIYEISGRQKMALYFQTTGDGVRLLLLFLAFSLGAPALIAIWIFSAASSVIDLLWLAVTLRIFEYSWRECALRTLTVAFALVACAAVFELFVTVCGLWLAAGLYGFAALLVGAVVLRRDLARLYLRSAQVSES
jgi:lipopolysaccharide exporter